MIQLTKKNALFWADDYMLTKTKNEHLYGVHFLILNNSACDPGETRTPNLLIRSQMLYPLSYGTVVKSGANIKLLSVYVNS